MFDHTLLTPIDGQIWLATVEGFWMVLYVKYVMFDENFKTSFTQEGMLFYEESAHKYLVFSRSSWQVNTFTLKFIAL
jgi:hypothetical protein